MSGRPAGRTRASLGALLDQWLPTAELGPNTRDNYAGLIERFIRPALGALPLSGRLTPQRIERFYGELRRCRARCDGRPFVEHRRAGEHDCAKAHCGPHECRPLAPSSVLVLHAILSGALEAAVRWDWVSVNVARAAKRPKLSAPHPDPPTPDQAAVLVTAALAQDASWGTLVWLVMTTGMRHLRELPVTETATVLGRVVDLHRTPTDRLGRVQVEGVVAAGGQRYEDRVTMRLVRRDYDLAVSAHGAGQLLRVVGELRHTGRQFEISRVSSVEIVPPPPS
ncbi:MAG: hypothetical protein ACRDRP_18585 [Pseudonocardiaceae bacterium]